LPLSSNIQACFAVALNSYAFMMQDVCQSVDVIGIIFEKQVADARNAAWPKGFSLLLRRCFYCTWG